jgi:hypothetical protein
LRRSRSVACFLSTCSRPACQRLWLAQAAAIAEATDTGKKGKAKKGKKDGPAEEEDDTTRASKLLELGAGADITSQLTTQQLMSSGRRTMSETEKSVLRSARLVEDTASVGQQTAVMLTEQGAQIERARGNRKKRGRGSSSAAPTQFAAPPAHFLQLLPFAVPRDAPYASRGSRRRHSLPLRPSRSFAVAVQEGEREGTRAIVIDTMGIA